MINIIAWLIFGLIAGAIARLLKPGQDKAGWIATIVIGIVGSVVGGFLGNLFFDADVTNDVFSFYSLGMSVLGGIIVLYAYNALSRD
ncbi:GlsB/YeaQ/YmgE family stress response membrane protein [Cloacibacterium sp.]|uniref:GlsB/YeaQ/YmgE family stress response membrane protein n=1 Tax=Cloacibacterium sp. TaxID=1913682 RepID=UPI0039E50F20